MGIHAIACFVLYMLGIQLLTGTLHCSTLKFCFMPVLIITLNFTFTFYQTLLNNKCPHKKYK